MFLGTWLLRYWHWSELVTWSSWSKNSLCLTFPLCTFSYVQSSKFLAINYWKVGFKPIKVQCFPGCCCIDYWRWTEDGLVVAFFICFFFFCIFMNLDFISGHKNSKKNVSGHCLHSSYLAPALLDDACQQLLAWCTNACMCPYDGPKISLVGACIVLWSVHVK